METSRVAVRRNSPLTMTQDIVEAQRRNVREEA